MPIIEPIWNHFKLKFQCFYFWPDTEYDNICHSSEMIDLHHQVSYIKEFQICFCFDNKLDQQRPGIIS